MSRQCCCICDAEQLTVNEPFREQMERRMPVVMNGFHQLTKDKYRTTPESKNMEN